MKKSSFPFGNAGKVLPDIHPALNDKREEDRRSEMCSNIFIISFITSADSFKDFSN